VSEIEETTAVRPHLSAGIVVDGAVAASRLRQLRSKLYYGGGNQGNGRRKVCSSSRKHQRRHVDTDYSNSEAQDSKGLHDVAPGKLARPVERHKLNWKCDGTQYGHRYK
jgi:hypothetical protein